MVFRLLKNHRQFESLIFLKWFCDSKLVANHLPFQGFSKVRDDEIYTLGERLLAQKEVKIAKRFQLNTVRGPMGHELSAVRAYTTHEQSVTCRTDGTCFPNALC
jgi:hypothetical protein